MKENKGIKVIDFRVIFKKLQEKRRVFFMTLPTAFIISSILIVCVPRYYSTETKMAPEIENPLSGGALGSIASSFGINLAETKTSDAITPLLYPDLMEDNGFVTSLFNIHVTSIDGKISTSYYDYLVTCQKVPWWTSCMQGLGSLFKKENTNKRPQTPFDPYRLSATDNDVLESIKGNISIHVNSKNGVITVSATAQDPLICKTLADSVRQKLQAHITTYRTNKARTDWEYYKKLTEEAKIKYEKARQQYGRYSDANTDIVLESFRAKQNDLENDMQLKYNTYTALNTQLQSAKAKVQERTPAFTLLKGASVPVRPAGPKRMMFVLSMVFLTFVMTSLWVLRKDMSQILK